MKLRQFSVRISASIAFSLLASTHAGAWSAPGAWGGQAKTGVTKKAASPKAFCIPAEAESTVVAAASATQTPTPSPSQTPEAASGYAVMIQEGHGDTGVLAAELYFGAATEGRSRLAGYADIADQSAATAGTSGASSGGTIDLKSTSQSPFRFELSIAATQDAQGAFDATLLDADLFTGAPLTNVAYKCWFKKL